MQKGRRGQGEIARPAQAPREPRQPDLVAGGDHRERDRLRAEIGSYNEGDRGRRGDAQERGRKRAGRAAKGGAAPAMVEDKGEEDGKKVSEGQGAAAPTHCRRRRGPGGSNNTKTECTLTVELGPSRYCGASHVVIWCTVKRHCDMIGGWLPAFDASDDKGRRLQDLARDAVRIGGVGRACAAALKFEAACCSACGLPETASTPISIPKTALGGRGSHGGGRQARR